MTYTNSDANVLSKYNPLEFDDEEVHELSQVFHDALQRLAWDHVVLLGPHLRRDTFAQCHPSSDLRRSRDAKHNVQTFEDVAGDWDVAGDEDGDDDERIGDGGGTWVLPAEQVVEEGVVVCQVLAGGCLRLRCLAGGGEVAELVGRVGSFVASFVGHRTLRERLHGRVVLDGVHRRRGRCWVRVREAGNMG